MDKANRLPLALVSHLPYEFGIWLNELRSSFKGPIHINEVTKHQYIAKVELSEGLRIVGQYNTNTQKRMIFERRRNNNGENLYRRMADFEQEKVEKVAIPNNFLSNGERS